MRESNGLCAQIFFGLSEFSYQTRVSIGHRIDMTLTHIITLNHVFFFFNIYRYRCVPICIVSNIYVCLRAS
jgi:hypothetical protein